jgi:uridine phosphorylase
MSKSEIITNADGSIYHLNLLPHQIAKDIIFVGDPDRVAAVSDFFDLVYYKVQHREFVTHTGVYNNKLITVISTGIGTDNVDIVLNELDLLLNYDFVLNKYKNVLTSANIVRIGTSGALDPDIAIDSILISEYAIGLDGLMNFYNFEVDTELKDLKEKAIAALNTQSIACYPYVAKCSNQLMQRFANLGIKGNTLTCNGFYAPQGRVLRYQLKTPHFLNNAHQIPVHNFEMETAGIYGLSQLLGHNALSLNAILANRTKGTFSSNPTKVVVNLIKSALEILSK